MKSLTLKRRIIYIVVCATVILGCMKVGNDTGYKLGYGSGFNDGYKAACDSLNGEADKYFNLYMESERKYIDKWIDHITGDTVR